MCPGCGQQLPTSTSRTGQRARYHGPACRQRALRARRAATPDRRALLDAVDRAEHALVDLRRLLLDGRPADPEAAAAELTTIATQLRGISDRPSAATAVETPSIVTEPVTEPVRQAEATNLAAPPATGVARPAEEERAVAPPATKPKPTTRRTRKARRRLIDTVDLDTVEMVKATDFEVSGRWRVMAEGPDGQVLLGTLRRGGGRLGSKHSWEAHDEHAVRAFGGPWPTRHDALIGLLLFHKDRGQ